MVSRGQGNRARKAFWVLVKSICRQQSPANVRESSVGTARYACLLDIFSQSEKRFCFAERIVPDLTVRLSKPGYRVWLVNEGLNTSLTTFHNFGGPLTRNPIISSR